MLRRYCDRCGSEMTTARCTFRFEIERPDRFKEEPEYPAGRGIYSKSPRIECDLCPDCLDSFTDWFTEFDDPETGEPLLPSQRTP